MTERARDLAEEQAEERRKADMMEVYWLEQRMAARGRLYPDPAPISLMLYAIPIGLSPEIVRYMEEVQRACEYASGSLPESKPNGR